MQQPFLPAVPPIEATGLLLRSAHFFFKHFTTQARVLIHHLAHFHSASLKVCVSGKHTLRTSFDHLAPSLFRYIISHFEPSALVLVPIPSSPLNIPIDPDPLPIAMQGGAQGEYQYLGFYSSVFLARNQTTHKASLQEKRKENPETRTCQFRPVGFLSPLDCLSSISPLIPFPPSRRKEKGG